MGPYGDSTGESDVISCWCIELRFPLEVAKGCKASCRVEVGIRGYSRGATGLSGLPLCRELILGVTFESLQGNEVLSRVDGDIRVFLNGGTTPGVCLEFQGETGLLLMCLERRDSFPDEVGEWTVISR